MMNLTFEIALIVILSTAPGKHEIVVYQFPTVAACKEVEKDLKSGVGKTVNPDTVVLGCRAGLSINLGDQIRDIPWPAPKK